MELTAFTSNLGRGQGRVETPDAASGRFAFVLGDLEAGRVFELAPGEAFGPRNADLVQRVSMATLRQHSSEDANYAVGDLVDFSAPGGGRFAGMLLELGEDDALFDFNHPLAGRSVKFEVNIIGIL